MRTAPVRVSETVAEEARAAARIIGCTPGALLAEAWVSYVRSHEFKVAFADAQKAIAGGDLGHVRRTLAESTKKRAAARAAHAADLELT